ncbi:futalosine hydrolase [Stieleria sp. ICT_E10.1]|uniref:futalosine hydrolase n=1 Tax=Stieleria sedimenti TaxID=2976331 RepID=UPI00217F58DD|nr:futalosine hydrolase [Stieleria sedimenti]MCS7466475.1 futalosine hydrolase [Stieleria sedimenti]
MNGLILVPTDNERRLIESSIRIESDQWTVNTIGFGVIAAGIETTRLLLSERPRQVILAGIAGLFSGPSTETLRLGDATWFDSVAIDGIGVGQGDAFVDAADLGWRAEGEAAPTDTIHLPTTPQSRASIARPALLLTVCAGSADEDDAARRLRRVPAAIGEDMEAYAVAYACQSAGVPLRVVRGFSNRVGCRDKSDWQIAPALASVAEQLQQYLDGETS